MLYDLYIVQMHLCSISHYYRSPWRYLYSSYCFTSLAYTTYM